MRNFRGKDSSELREIAVKGFDVNARWNVFDKNISFWVHISNVFFPCNSDWVLKDLIMVRVNSCIFSFFDVIERNKGKTS
jgi:hypothetical protein